MTEAVTAVVKSTLRGVLTGMGFENVEKFRFHSGEYPMSTWPAIMIAIAIYLVTIFSLKAWMKNREKFSLSIIVPIHNTFLMLLSLLMGIGLIFEMTQIAVRPGTRMEVMLCDSEKKLAVGPQIVWFYIFLLSKFYELLDTVIIILKKRPLIFLHVYHHFITIVLTYAMLDNEVAMQWFCIIANVIVHVPMYQHYAISSLGISVWWKKYITMLQIVQFVGDLVLNSMALMYFSNKEWTCSGSKPTWLFGQAVLLSFLVLFILFFKSTYERKDSSKKSD